MRRARVLALAALVASALAFVPAKADPPAVFQVGFSVKNIDPCDTCPQYLGGFGYGDPVDGTGVHDPLQVRAMAIESGGTLVEFAIVDTQGYFAGNQEGPYGSRDARIDAATALHAWYPYMSEQQIIVSSTHLHAAPTIMGIWGPTDVDYLKQVHDATRDALVEAADPTTMKQANLYTATADISAAIISAINQTDGYQGWRPDGQTPVLWARDPSSGKTLGLYANVPVHADIVNGVDTHTISADHIGYERSFLDRDLGGTSVVAMGTLGRQESIIQVKGLAHAEALGTYVVNQIERALATATPITDPTVGYAEQYLLIPATNPALTALNEGNNVLGPTQVEVGGENISWTIDRSVDQPYALGACFGAWFTAFRIGNLAYATEPGEAFPEVSTAIRRTFALPAENVRIVGMAQDQLGYYFPPESYPFTEYNSSDHQIYNASLFLGEANVKAHALNAMTLGFGADLSVHETNQWDDVAGTLYAGVQFFPELTESVSATRRFDVRTSDGATWDVPSAVLLGAGPSLQMGVGAVTWDFGHGDDAFTQNGYFATHTFPGPGAYTVTATVHDPRTGDPATYTWRVIVDPPLSATVDVNGDVLTAGVTGGQGTIIAAHWTFSDSSTADGITVTRPAGTNGTVTVVDGAGNTATASF